MSDPNAESPTVDAESRFSFRCPSCKSKCKSKVKHVGKRVNCPRCHASIVVPSYTGVGASFEDLEMTDLLNRDTGSEWDIASAQSGPATPGIPSVPPTPATLPGRYQIQPDAPTIRDWDVDADDDAPSIDMSMRAAQERNLLARRPGLVAVLVLMSAVVLFIGVGVKIVIQGIAPPKSHDQITLPEGVDPEQVERNQNQWKNFIRGMAEKARENEA